VIGTEEANFVERMGTAAPFKVDLDLVDEMTTVHDGSMYTIQQVIEKAQGNICLQFYAGPDLSKWPGELDDALEEIFDTEVKFNKNVQCTYIVVPIPTLTSVEAFMKPRLEKLFQRLGLV
jgi:hypothetical protein